MDDQKALSIVSALANGVNPLSGEVFPVDSPYQASDVVRALFAAARALERVADRRRTTASPSQRLLLENERAPRCRATSASRGVPRRISACSRNSSEGRSPAELAETARTHARRHRGAIWKSMVD